MELRTAAFHLPPGNFFLASASKGPLDLETPGPERRPPPPNPVLPSLGTLGKVNVALFSVSLILMATARYRLF